MQDAEQFLGFLHSLSDMGAAMRRVMAEALTNKSIYKTLTTGKNNDCTVMTDRPWQRVQT